MSHISMSDAIVALRSFPRRFAEELAGPLDDDAWVRLLVARPDGGLSALDVVQQATLRLDALAATLTQLPRASAARTTTAFHWQKLDDLGPSPSETFKDLMAEFKRAANGAGDAVEARRDDDLDRNVSIDATDSTIGAYLDDVVTQTASDIRHLSEVLDKLL